MAKKIIVKNNVVVDVSDTEFEIQSCQVPRPSCISNSVSETSTTTLFFTIIFLAIIYTPLLIQIQLHQQMRVVH
jgi:hypothetical protein